MASRRKCRKCGRNRAERFFTGPRGTICVDCQREGRRQTARNRRVEATYGITDEEYDAIAAEQGGVCGGCGEERRYKLHVDHDHHVERHLLAAGMSPQEAARWSVRGLLCKRCNKVLRDVRDSTKTLAGLVWYLDFPPARRVIGTHQLLA